MGEQAINQGKGEGVLGGAAYLACSWTWCIGMWFPVYLAADYGWVSWFVFAVPNVIGAMSVGFVLRDRASARDLIERHGWMVSVFSVWTILFHVMFLSAVVLRVRDAVPFLPGEMVGLGILGLIVLFASLEFRRAAVAAIVVWVLSVGFGAAAWATGGFALPEADGAFSKGAMAMMAPVIAFGFLMCPFLDGTLVGVRARLEGGRGRAAFVIGFGVMFLAMIAMTLGYAGNWLGGGGYSYYILPGHIGVQGAFTVAVHLRLLARRGVIGGGGLGVNPGRGRGWRTVWFGVGALLVAYASMFVRLEDLWLREGYSGQRLLYDTFLGAYGLVFPAYVWTMMVGRRCFGLSTRGALVGWGVGVVVGLPCLVMGAFMQEHVWMLGALGGGLVGVFIGRAMGRTPGEDTP